jgi:hypothetical protein
VNAAEVKRKQAARLNAAGHSMTWRKTGATAHCGTCQRCGGRVDCDEYGPHWRGGSPGQPVSLLRWMGVNVVRRCPGRTR